MKTQSITFLVAISSLLINCGNNKAATNDTQLTNSSSTEKKEEPGNVAAPSGDVLVGTWKLQKEVFDDNSNRIPDQEELKKAYSNNYMLQFNADGSCRIQQMFTGRYEKKVEKGRDMLYVYRKKIEGEEDTDPIPDVYQVTSMKKDELVLQIVDAGTPGSFWFFKRIN